MLANIRVGRLEASQTENAHAVYPVNMMRAILAAAAVLLVAGTVSAQDAERGRLLYETHCDACHVERLHERKRSAVDSIETLRLQVERWTKETRRAFSAAEREDLVEYLATTHYRSRLVPAGRAR
jgi:mono/diheme cytochrome c family protein